MRYQRNPFSSWENEVSGAAVGILGVIILFAAAIALAILVALVKELWRVYQARAIGQPDTPAAQRLWIALACFVGILLLSGLLATSGALAPLAAYLVSWGFLLFVIAVEAIDHLIPDTNPSDEVGGLLLGEKIT